MTTFLSDMTAKTYKQKTPFSYGLFSMTKYKFNRYLDSFFKQIFFPFVVIAMCIVFSAYKGCEMGKSEQIKRQKQL